MDKNNWKIVSIRWVVVDIAFSESALPRIYDAIITKSKNVEKKEVMIEVM